MALSGLVAAASALLALPLGGRAEGARRWGPRHRPWPQRARLRGLLESRHLPEPGRPSPLPTGGTGLHSRAARDCARGRGAPPG